MIVRSVLYSHSTTQSAVMHRSLFGSDSVYLYRQFPEVGTDFAYPLSSNETPSFETSILIYDLPKERASYTNYQKILVLRNGSILAEIAEQFWK